MNDEYDTKMKEMNQKFNDDIINRSNYLETQMKEVINSFLN
jgi:hypothetical protein